MNEMKMGKSGRKVENVGGMKTVETGISRENHEDSDFVLLK